MKAQIIVFVVALFCANANAQQCYRCSSITTDGEDLELPSTLDDTVSCGDPLDNLETKNCTRGCMTANLSLKYNITGTGTVNVNTFFRTCNQRAPADTCRNDTVVQDWEDFSRSKIGDLLPSDGTDFVSATGTACSCTSNLCNNGNEGLVTSMAPVWKISYVSFLMSLIISYIAI